MADVFITGGTGYIGRALIPELLRRGHGVRALVRPGSEGKLPRGAAAIAGDAPDGASVRDALGDAGTLIHLVGVAHPSPAKARLFRQIDLASVRASVAAARGRGVRHFVYVSVAHPAPAMQAYVAARMEGEALIREAGLDATIVRPWYVLGPGHWWPVAALPAYWVAERLPPTRSGALRLGLVRLGEMVAALAMVVENPPVGIRILEVPEIRAAGRCLPGFRPS